MECNEDSLSVTVPSKFKKCLRAARLLLFFRDKFVIRRHLKRFRKNRNCSRAQEPIHLAAVTRTADGCVNNNIKFASYLTGNRPKRISKKQRPNTRIISCHTLKSVNAGSAKGEALRLLGPNSSRSTFNKNVQSFWYA